jgi:thioredoxin 1
MKQIDSTQFQAEVLQSAVPVVADFYTAQCQPCRVVSTVLEAIEGERAGALKIVKVDAAAEAEFTASFRIMAVPTLLLYRGGQLIAQMTGGRSERELQTWIDDALR